MSLLWSLSTLLLFLQTITMFLVIEAKSHPSNNSSTTTTDSLGCGTAPLSCPKSSKYRSYDGSCNNLQNPIWGTPNTPYGRLLPANYADGLGIQTAARSGNRLPGSRTVSLVLYPDEEIVDTTWTLNAMQYGQIIIHDTSMTAGNNQIHPNKDKCCSDDGHILELVNDTRYCFPIIVPKNDPHFSINHQCISFLRTVTDRDRHCMIDKDQPVEQLTQVNHFLDLSNVYGNDAIVNRQVRQFKGGRLRVDRRNGKEWPPRSPNATTTCTLRNVQESCYLAGDSRVNQNTQLTLLQIVLLREHNRIADALATLNPHWIDETIFQESRRIAIAEHQFISYYEWLPIFIGEDNAVPISAGFLNDYDATVNPSILNEYATAAFRFFHSLIAGHLDLVTEGRDSDRNIRLSDWFNRPSVLEQDDNFDELARGLASQPELASDQFHDSEITQFLFKGNRSFGFDLKALDIQRNRDHGLASYNSFREYCGLVRAETFDDFLDVISKDNVEKLASLYEVPDDVDLTVGGSLETLVPRTLAGPTFLCILIEQFERSRIGDRFWFENDNPKIGFTLEQLNEIRKTSLSRLLCDNGHHIKAMQPNGFKQISSENDVVPCEQLPDVDLTLWKDVQLDEPKTLPDKKSHYLNTMMWRILNLLEKIL